MAIAAFPYSGVGIVAQADASTQDISSLKIVSTDPPYYDNIGYADLSDYFYVWLRRSLKASLPTLFATLAVPKVEELIASPPRHGSKQEAQAFFLSGMTGAMKRLAEKAHPDFPVTIYYAFKQSETNEDGQTASTGWDTFLEAVVRAGFGIDGTWPMRTEGAGRINANEANALASSIVLVCRKRSSGSSSTTRKEFLAALQRELKPALSLLQRGNIAPVDVAQASIGPGMGIFTKYEKVVAADGSRMTVRDALHEINKTLDSVLSDQEGNFDSETRFAIYWHDQYQWGDGAFGDAEKNATPRGVSIPTMERRGILQARAGKVHLIERENLPDPTQIQDGVPTIWLLTQYLIKALEKDSIDGAAQMWHKAGPGAELARDLAYRLYTMCERKKLAKEAGAYNGLVIAWPDIVRRAQELKQPTEKGQGKLFGSSARSVGNFCVFEG